MAKKSSKKPAIDFAQVGGLALGGVGSGYVAMVGRMSPVMPNQVGAALSIAAGLFLVKKPGFAGALGAGLIAGGAKNLGNSFGIGGEEIVNGYDEQYMLNGHDDSVGIIDADIINGFIEDDAVQTLQT